MMIRSDPGDAAGWVLVPSMLVEAAGTRPHDGACIRRRALGYQHAVAVDVGNADDRVVIRRRRAWLERFQDRARRLAWTGAHAGLGDDTNQLDTGRNLERDRRLVGQRQLEEVARDRSRKMAAGRGIASAERARLVIAHIDAD